jgi:protein-S-isoprenylcysteine O-methyltransferase Ste14
MASRVSPLASLLAWSGGAIFVVSLAVGAWFFVVPLGRVIEGTLAAGDIAWNLALFTLFAVHHSVFARFGLRARLTRALGPGFERPLYVWAASLLFILVVVWWRPLAGVAWAWPAALRPWVWILPLSGLVFTALGARAVDIFDLAGIERSGHVHDTDGFRLVDTGPYALVRHPIYLGWVLIVWGVPVMTTGRLVFALVSTAYLVMAVPLEERSLVTLYGETYRAYQRKVRWRMVPGVY